MPTTAHHVLIVDDEPVGRMRLAQYFEAAGYRVSQAQDGAIMRESLSLGDVDLLLLDINLPGDDGLTLVKEIRGHSDIGIILVTGRTDDVDRIVGLELGADDYVTKPVNMRELLARVKNLLRRAGGFATRETEDSVRRFERWALDIRKRQLYSHSGDRVALTRAEFELLKLFTEWPGVILNRDRLMNHVTHRSWDPGDRTIDVLVRRLRRKLEVDSSAPELIVTVHGEGYQFTATVE